MSALPSGAGAAPPSGNFNPGTSSSSNGQHTPGHSHSHSHGRRNNTGASSATRFDNETLQQSILSSSLFVHINNTTSPSSSSHTLSPLFSVNGSSHSTPMRSQHHYQQLYTSQRTSDPNRGPSSHHRHDSLPSLPTSAMAVPSPNSAIDLAHSSMLAATSATPSPASSEPRLSVRKRLESDQTGPRTGPKRRVTPPGNNSVHTSHHSHASTPSQTTLPRRRHDNSVRSSGERGGQLGGDSRDFGAPERASASASTSFVADNDSNNGGGVQPTAIRPTTPVPNPFRISSIIHPQSGMTSELGLFSAPQLPSARPRDMNPNDLQDWVPTELGPVRLSELNPVPPRPPVSQYRSANASRPVSTASHIPVLASSSGVSNTAAAPATRTRMEQTIAVNEMTASAGAEMTATSDSLTSSDVTMLTASDRDMSRAPTPANANNNNSIANVTNAAAAATNAATSNRANAASVPTAAASGRYVPPTTTTASPTSAFGLATPGVTMAQPYPPSHQNFLMTPSAEWGYPVLSSFFLPQTIPHTTINPDHTGHTQHPYSAPRRPAFGISAPSYLSVTVPSVSAAGPSSANTTTSATHMPLVAASAQASTVTSNMAQASSASTSTAAPSVPSLATLRQNETDSRASSRARILSWRQRTPSGPGHPPTEALDSSVDGVVEAPPADVESEPDPPWRNPPPGWDRRAITRTVRPRPTMANGPDSGSMLPVLQRREQLQEQQRGHHESDQIPPRPARPPHPYHYGYPDNDEEGRVIGGHLFSRRPAFDELTFTRPPIANTGPSHDAHHRFGLTRPAAERSATAEETNAQALGQDMSGEGPSQPSGLRRLVLVGDGNPDLPRRIEEILRQARSAAPPAADDLEPPAVETPTTSGLRPLFLVPSTTSPTASTGPVNTMGNATARLATPARTRPPPPFGRVHNLAGDADLERVRMSEHQARLDRLLQNTQVLEREVVELNTRLRAARDPVDDPVATQRFDAEVERTLMRLTERVRRVRQIQGPTVRGAHAAASSAVGTTPVPGLVRNGIPTGLFTGFNDPANVAHRERRTAERQFGMERERPPMPDLREPEQAQLRGFGLTRDLRSGSPLPSDRASDASAGPIVGMNMERMFQMARHNNTGNTGGAQAPSYAAFRGLDTYGALATAGGPPMFGTNTRFDQAGPLGDASIPPAVAAALNIVDRQQRADGGRVNVLSPTMAGRNATMFRVLPTSRPPVVRSFNDIPDEYKITPGLNDCERAATVKRIAVFVTRMSSPNRRSFAQRTLTRVKWADVSEDGMERDECCAVCQDDYEPTDKVAVTACKHMFHETCLTQWLETPAASSCPMCRRDLASLGFLMKVTPEGESVARKLWLDAPVDMARPSSWVGM